MNSKVLKDIDPSVMGFHCYFFTLVGCDSPLGMEDGSIPDSAITANTQVSKQNVYLYTLTYDTKRVLIGHFGRRKPMGFCLGKLPLHFPIWQDCYIQAQRIAVF